MKAIRKKQKYNQTNNNLTPKDRLQVNAFKSIFHQNLRLGLSVEEAFAEGLVVTSDERFEKCDSKLIQKYLSMKKGKLFNE